MELYLNVLMNVLKVLLKANVYPVVDSMRVTPNVVLSAPKNV